MVEATIFVLDMDYRRRSGQIDREAWKGIAPASQSPREWLAAILYALATRLAPVPERPGARRPVVEA